jgi:hypothetical protein
MFTSILVLYQALVTKDPVQGKLAKLSTGTVVTCEYRRNCYN